MIASRKKIYLLIGFLTCFLLFVYQSILIVPEGYTTLLLRAGTFATDDPVYNQRLKPGLHFKLPFLIQSAQLNNRLQTLLFREPSSLVTAREKPIVIDYYIKWRMVDPVLYYEKTTNNLPQVKLLIIQTVNQILHHQESLQHSLNTTSSPNRISLLNTILPEVNDKLAATGIRIIDIGLKQIEFSPEADEALLKNMQDEQDRIAIEQRESGKTQAEIIRATADTTTQRILAQAREKAAYIKGQGDAEAAKIYNQAYLKNPEFAAFYLNIEAYKKGFTQPSPSTNNFLALNSRDEFSNGLKKGIRHNTETAESNIKTSVKQ